MDDKELMICLMKNIWSWKKKSKAKKAAGDYWFQECERLKMSRNNDYGLSHAEREYITPPAVRGFLITALPVFFA